MADKVLFEIPLTKWRATDVIGVGQVRREGSKAYKWLKNSITTVACQVGGTYYYGAEDPQTQVYLLAQTASVTKAQMAGVAMSTIPNGEYGWFQVQGTSSTCLVCTSGSAIAIGDSLETTGSEHHLENGIAMATAKKYDTHVTSLVVIASSTTPTASIVAIRCL